MLCLKKRRTYSFTQGTCNELPRRSKKDNMDNESLNIAVTTLPRKHRGREERPAMVLTVTEDTPADMLAGSMELLVQLPRDHNVQTQRVTVQRSTPMMDLLVQVATAHKLVASSYTLQAIGERGMVLPHQPNTPIGALDALQVKLLPKQGTFLSRKTRQANQPFETTFRLQVHLPRNQLYVSRVSPKMNLGDILEEVCREKNLDMKKYELRHPANLEEILDLSLSLQDYHLQEVTLYAKQGRIISAALSSQDIMALQKQEDRRRQQAKQSVFGFMFKKSKENSLSTDSLGERSVSPARSDETGRSSSPMAPPPRPLRKRRQAPKPPVSTTSVIEETSDSAKDKMVISHSRNSSDSSGYHEASVLSDHPESAGRMPETLPRRGKTLDTPRNLAQTSHASKSLGNLALASGGLSHGISTTSLSSTGQRKKRAAPPPPIAKLPSAISSQALECIVDSEESLTSDMELSKPSSDIATSSKANSDIAVHYKANSDIGITTLSKLISNSKSLSESEENTRIREKEAVAAEKISETDRKIRETETSSKEDASKPVLNHEPVVTSANKPVVANAKVVKRDSPARLSETDILLQKVSDTLSSALPPTPPPTPLESLEVSRIVDLEISKKEPKKQKTIVESQKSTCPSEEKQSSSKDHISEKSIIGTSSPDVTVNSQQDTSDYVSASGEDLSLPDWEYQLPAPPTAFRDVETSSIVISESDCPQKQEIIPPPISTDQTDSTLNFPQNQKFKSIEKSPENLKTEIPSKMENKTRQISPEAYKSELNLELKREMISELESKIEIRSQQPQAKHEIEDVSTPNIAPVDNTLSNFTFTTYARQKSLNIFDEIEEQSVPLVKTSNEKSRATLTLQRNEESKDRMAHKPIDVTTKVFISRTQSIERVTTPLDSELRRPEYKTNQQGNLNRRQSLKSEIDKPVTVYRSKSYITLTSNEKYKGHSNEEENEKITLEEESEKTTTSSNIQKATSVTNLNQDMTRSNEKFSQWRDNILKRQEEPTKEKQLQSLQVLKSILPQLKNAQQAEENVRKNAIEKQPTTDKKSETVPEESSRAEPKITTTTNDVQMRSELKNRKVNPEKRYTYSGPPAVSLGSWSERPCVNVQIKMDTDYKLGVNNTSGSKTIVNLNGSRNERDPINTQEITSRTLPKNTINGFKEKETKSESNDFSKKAITQTTITAFKKPTIINKMNYTDSTEVKPIVTSVELKKLDKSENHEIETKSIKFEELSKTFGQEVRLRTKPKSSISQNRHSEYFGRNSEIVNNIVNAGNNNNNNNNKQNGYQEANNHVTTFNGTQNIPIKKYTSVVGINSQSNNNFRFQNGQLSKNNNVTSMRINGPMPIVKGFNVLPSQISTVTVKQNESSVVDSSKNDARIPKPPTMPIITGVTLKSANARPKSMPVNIDPRDQLLESIRNFGGRDKLRSAAGRY
ncbi:protein cordon-bleu isoform X5 [Leptopilina heterotoma]|uniref:protein cordon-bleu isoform X5 n=1 Tax=Leptopilina heterotoma TaxID=63436 RepID=UPI001CA90F10|nr:protein cordon-bleu isoform X5 [Leptopilina heterotoma]